MKKVAIVTVAVLALGLAACNKNNADNNAANETAVENTASTDVNAADRQRRHRQCRRGAERRRQCGRERRQRRRQRAERGREQVSFRLQANSERAAPSGRPFFCASGEVVLGPSEEADSSALRCSCSPACRDQRPPAPTAEQSAAAQRGRGHAQRHGAKMKKGRSGSPPALPISRTEQSDLEVHSAHAAHAAAGHRHAPACRPAHR